MGLDATICASLRSRIATIDGVTIPEKIVVEAFLFVMSMDAMHDDLNNVDGGVADAPQILREIHIRMVNCEIDLTSIADPGLAAQLVLKHEGMSA